MNPLRIAYGDQAKLKTLTDSTEALGYPGTNAVHPHLSRVWRTTAAAAQWIKFDAGVGGVITFDTACIIGHNLTSAAVVSVQTSTADAWAPPDTASRNGDPTQAIITVDLGPSPTAVRYARVYIDDAANPAGYLSIGRVFLCTRWEGDPIDRGFSVAINDTTVITRSLTGQAFADLGVISRIYSLSLGTMQNTTKQSLLTLLQSVGQWDPVVVFPAESTIPGAAEGINPIYATMSKSTKFTDAGGWGWTDDGLSFIEAH